MMALRSLERAAILGMLGGIGCLVLDALSHSPARVYRYLPRLRPGRHLWSHAAALWHSRPALSLGLLLLCAALIMALVVMVTVLVRELTGRDVPSGSSPQSG